MALIGHWPLNGDTRNFAGTIQVAGSITYSNEGKIGKCMDSGSLTLPPGNMNNRSQSITFWYYNKAASSATAKSSQFMGGSSPRDYSLFTYPNNDDLHWDFRNLSNSTIFSGVLSGVLKNLEWTHITIINDNLHFKIYINGVLEQSKIVASWDNDFSEKSFPLLINNPEGRYNDLRLYDHALTDFEVQELYKTKIIHYTFDNEVESTTNIINTSPLSIYNNHGVPASITTLPITRNGAPIYRVSMTATSTALSSFRNSYANQGIMTSTNSFAANTPHTSSIMWRVKQGPPNIKVRGTPSNIGGWSDRGTYLTDDGWNRTIATRAPYGTTVKDSLFWSFMSPDIQLDDVIIIEWTSPQLETKDHFTEFTRTNRDRKQISDLSDFRNNGTLTGDLEITKESAIGNGSIIFDSSNAKININTINPLPSEVSISYWRKTVPEVNGSGWLPFVGQTTSHYIMATTGGTGAFYHSGNVGDRAKNIYIDGVKIGTSTPPAQDNNWHHYVITGLDLSTWTQFNINGYSSSWNMLGNMDDFRMYATTLTDGDIKDLYETKAEIDKGSTLYAKDFTDNVNLLDPDIFYGYANSGTPEKQVFDNRKVWVPYPARFHPNGALRGLFKENIRYKIHLVYTHFTYYDVIANYVPGGLTIKYTDGTEHHLTYTPTGPDPDWRTLNYITPEGKTVSNIWVYYYTSYALYISEESFMVEYNEDDISNKGISKFLDYSTVGITDGLVGYWPLNKNSKDYSGSNYDLTDPNINVSIRDGARFIGTSNQKLFVENFPKYTSNFTWSVDLINTVQNTSQQFVVSLGRDCCNVFGMSIVVNNGIIEVYIGTDTVINTNISCVNLLRNVTVSVDSANVRVYVDGIQTNIIAIPVFNYGTSTALVVGKMSHGYTSDTTYFPFNGIIKNFKIFNRALTAEEIAIEYNTMFNNEVQIHESGVLYAKDLKQY